MSQGIKWIAHLSGESGQVALQTITSTFPPVAVRAWDAACPNRRRTGSLPSGVLAVSAVSAVSSFISRNQLKINQSLLFHIFE
jgi:hypothetical protein